MGLFPMRLRSLTMQLLVLTVFPMLILLILVSYGGISLHEQAMHNLVSARDERAVRATAEALADRFVQRRLVLQALAERIGDGVSLARALDAMPDLRQVFDTGLIVVNAQGTITDSWQPGTPWASSLHSTTIPWVLDHDRPAPMLVANARSTNGTFTLYGGLSLTSLGVPDTMKVMQSTAETHLYLIAEDGHIIADSAAQRLGQSASDWPDLAPVFAAKDIADHTAAGHTDPEVLTVSSTVEGLGWMLVVREPWNAVTSPTLQLSLVAPLAIIPAILLAMGVLAFGLVSVVSPLRRLGRSAARLAWGDYEAIQQPAGGVQEIRDLQTTLSHMAQRLQQAQTGMRSYIGAMLQGQEDERKRLARELHDDTLQSLIAVDQRRQMAQRALERDPAKVPGHLEQLQTMLDQGIKNLRHLIQAMRPTYIEDLGLVTALEALITQNAEATPVVIQFTVTGPSRRLPPNHELGLYRIAQEAITNAIRHASATQINVKLGFDGGVALNIQDNGQGFVIPDRPGTFAQAGHYGLMGMVERAEQMGAQFRIDSAPGKGTTIDVSVAPRQA